MKSKQIEILNNLTDENAKLKLIAGWLVKKEITVDNLMSCCISKRVTLSAKLICELATSFGQKKHGLKKDSKKALQLYLFAAKHLNSTLGIYRCALYYYDGRAGTVNIDEAYRYCNLAIERQYDGKLLMAKILIEMKKYSEALTYLKGVTDEKKLIEAAKLKKICFKKSLKELYQLVDVSIIEENTSTEMEVDEDSTDHSETITEDNKPLPGWHSISESIDGFDPTECGELSAKLALISLEKATAKRALKIANSHLKKAKKKKSSEEVIEALTSEKAKCSKHLTEVLSKKVQLTKHYQAYVSVMDNTIRRQYQAECHFFNPKRSQKKETQILSNQLLKRRLKNGTAKNPIEVTNVPARRLITAELSTVKNSNKLLKLHKRHSNYVSSLGWMNNPELERTNRSSFSNYSYSKSYSFDETVKLGETEVCYRQRTNPHVNHLGDFYSCDLGTYKNIVSHLNLITGTNKDKIAVKEEKKLAKSMIKYCRLGEPITIEVLKKINPEADADESDVHKLNQIFYHCFIKEIASWMLPKDDSHKLPLATAQSRALHLIASGYLSIGEVFSPDAPYGVYTGSNIGKDENIHKLRDKIVNINILYHKIMFESVQDPLSPYTVFFKQHKKGEVVPTREKQHKELKETFGGSDNETDGEGYDTDEERDDHYKKIMLP